ncbi:MAG: hypothetical protein ACOYM2_20485 [Rectinemataceae bacterium]
MNMAIPIDIRQEAYRLTRKEKVGRFQDRRHGRFLMVYKPMARGIICFLVVLCFLGCEIPPQASFYTSRYNRTAVLNAINTQRELYVQATSLAARYSATSREIDSTQDVLSPEELVQSAERLGIDGATDFMQAAIVDMDASAVIESAQRIVSDPQVSGMMTTTQLEEFNTGIAQISAALGSLDAASSRSTSRSYESGSVETARVIAGIWAGLGACALLYCYVPSSIPWLKLPAAVCLAAYAAFAGKSLANAYYGKTAQQVFDILTGAGVGAIYGLGIIQVVGANTADKTTLPIVIGAMTAVGVVMTFFGLVKIQFPSLAL